MKGFAKAAIECKQNRPLCEGCDRAKSLMCYSYSSEVRTAEKRQPYLMEQHPAWLFFCAGAESGDELPNTKCRYFDCCFTDTGSFTK